MPYPRRTFWFVLSLLLTILPLTAEARPSTASTAAYKSGFPATVANQTFYEQSAVVAEIVPSSPGLEIAIPSREGYLSVFSKDGRLLWQAQVPPTLCANAEARLTRTMPAVGTLDGDGVPYVVIGYGNHLARSHQGYCPGGVAAFHGPTGALKWRFSTHDLTRPKVETFSGVISVPALADSDGDGKMEVAFGSLDRHMYLLDHNGNLIWRFHTADTVWASPTFYDVDGDKRLEVVFPSDISENKSYGVTNGGFVYAFKTTVPDPEQVPDRRISFSGDPAKIPNLVWRSPNFDQALYSSPAIGDVTGDGVDDLVIASGCIFKDASGNPTGKWIQILNLSDGSVIRTIPVQTCSTASPALADLNGDGVLDIVLPLNGQYIIGPDNQPECRVIAVTGNGRQLWNVEPTVFGGYSDPGCHLLKSVSIADLDNNGSQEVLVNNALGIVILAGSNGRQLSVDNPPTLLLAPPRPLEQGLPSHSLPVVADLDGDGTLEVVSAVDNKVLVWSNLKDAIKSESDSRGVPGYAAWPMFQANPQRLSTVTPMPVLLVTSDSIGAVITPDAGKIVTKLSLQVKGASELTWEVSGAPEWAILSATSGSTKTPLLVTLDPSKLNNKPGTYNGEITIMSSSGLAAFMKDGAVNKQLTIKLRLIISDTVMNSYLPIIRK